MPTETINDVTLLKHVRPIPGVNRCIFYIGTACTYFPYYTKHENLASLQYLGEQASKVWYVIALSHRSEFEYIVDEYVYDPEFRNDPGDGAREILAMKIIVLHPMFMVYKNASFNFVPVLQPKGPFLIAAPTAYHGGFNTIYSVAKATSFSNYSWIEVDWAQSRNTARQDQYK